LGEDRGAEVLGAGLRAGAGPAAAAIEAALRQPGPIRPVELPAFVPDLGIYDQLILEVAS
jgi:hypothetical protein